MLGSGWRQGRWRRSSSCNEVSAKVCTYNEFRGEGVGSDHGGGVKSGVQRLLLKFQTRRTCTCQCAFAVRGAAVVRIWIMWHYHAMCWCIFSCPGGSTGTLGHKEWILSLPYDIGPMTTPWLTKIVQSGQFRTLAMFLNLVQIKAGRLLSHLWSIFCPQLQCLMPPLITWAFSYFHRTVNCNAVSSL